jgi:ankyrin repeat protein
MDRRRRTELAYLESLKSSFGVAVDEDSVQKFTAGDGGTIEPPPTPLLTALWAGERATALALIAAGADPNAADTRPVIGNGTTTLHIAADADDVELVRALVAVGAEVNARSLAGHTPLWWACNAGSCASVRELLAAGANPNIRCKEGYSPLGRVLQSDSALMELMRSHGGVV